MRKLIIGISGATGAIYAIRLLEVLKDYPDVEVHVIVSPSARETIHLETDVNFRDLLKLADHYYDYRDISARVASGSFLHDGMIIVPCSIKTLSAVAHCYTDNLLARAADVCLKERRKLLLAVRETPLHLGHLRLMTQVAEMGGIIMPPVPAFYHHPRDIKDIIDQTVNRILDQFQITLARDLFPRWNGGNSQLSTNGEETSI